MIHLYNGICVIRDFEWNGTTPCVWLSLRKPLFPETNILTRVNNLSELFNFLYKRSPSRFVISCDEHNYTKPLRHLLRASLLQSTPSQVDKYVSGLVGTLASYSRSLEYLETCDHSFPEYLQNLWSFDSPLFEPLEPFYVDISRLGISYFPEFTLASWVYDRSFDFIVQDWFNRSRFQILKTHGVNLPSRVDPALFSPSGENHLNLSEIVPHKRIPLNISFINSLSTSPREALKRYTLANNFFKHTA